MAEAVEHLCIKCEALGSKPSNAKTKKTKKEKTKNKILSLKASLGYIVSSSKF
jgi:hypothetical protein